MLKKIFLNLMILMPILAVGLSGISFAQVNPQEQACTGAGGTWGDIPNTTEVESGCTLAGARSVSDIIKSVVNILIYIIGALSVLMIIVGGLRYVVSAGDANATTGAKNTILYAVIGLVVAIAAYAIVNFVLTKL